MCVYIYIYTLKDDIAANQLSLDKATAIREEEKGEFETTDKDRLLLLLLLLCYYNWY